jgi:PIN domain nuclease of toxin-antitoxin system
MSNRLLLDTCAVIWLSEGAEVAPAVLSVINDVLRKDGAIFLSPVSAWEIGMLVAKGRIKLRLDPVAAYRALLRLPKVEEAALTAEILVGSSFLPGRPHADPFDRVIVATARERGLTIVTRDHAILSYAEAGHVAALEC